MNIRKTAKRGLFCWMAAIMGIMLLAEGFLWMGRILGFIPEGTGILKFIWPAAMMIAGLWLLTASCSRRRVAAEKQ